MKEFGTGRTRMGRFAAVMVPGTVGAVGLGLAITQGMMGAALASATAFDVAGTSATGDGLEVTANYTEAATSDADATATDKHDLLLSLENGVVNDLCLAADTAVPVVGTVGIKITSPGSSVSLGSGWTDLAADSVGADELALGETMAGYAQSELSHQDATNSPGYAAGGFSLASSDALTIDALDASVYATTLAGLTLENLALSATLGSVESTC